MRTRSVMATLGCAILLGVGGATAATVAERHPVASDECTDAITELDGSVVAFELQPLNLNSCFGSAEDFVFRAWPPDATPEQSQLIRVRYVWSDDGEAPPDDMRTTDRTWHIVVSRDHACDANIDELRNRQIIFEDGRPSPLLPYFQPASGVRAEAIPPGTSLACYVLRSNDAR